MKKSIGDVKNWKNYFMVLYVMNVNYPTIAKLGINKYGHIF